MLFNSPVFLFVFLPVVLLGYVFANRMGARQSLVWLVASSLFFYGWWNPLFLWVIAASIAFNFTIGTRLIRSPRLWLLVLGIALNLALIGYYKYSGFFSEILNALADTGYSTTKLLLPLGISFFTFQQIAYLVDSYNGRAERHDLLRYALFVTFFPQLIAGPIVHQAEIMPQLERKNKSIRQGDLALGLTIFIIGLFKKAVIADHMSGYVSPMFAGAEAGETITFLEAWGGSLAYTFQLYFDFSGYSDMAIGLGLMFGVRLPDNFNSPLKAHSIIDFWQRWHMTMTRFFMGYVHHPVVARIARWRAARGLSVSQKQMSSPGPFIAFVAMPTILTMFLVGLWHGAGWTFVAFGVLHGVYLVINHIWRILRHRKGGQPKTTSRVWVFVSWLLVFLCVVVGFVVFRAPTLGGALNILHGMSGLDGRFVVTSGYVPLLSPFEPLFGQLNVSPFPLLYYAGREEAAWIAGSMAIVLLLPNTMSWMGRFDSLSRGSDKKPQGNVISGFLPRWRPTYAWAAIMVAMLASSLVATWQPSEFLYFQF